jgi:CheY-like chemotaxis protein
MSEYKYNCVMLIDDSEIDNMVNAHILSKNNIAKNIIVHSSANDALNYLSKIASDDSVVIPDVILLDINMPIMNGFGFLLEFEKFDESLIKNIKVVMLTSSVDPNDIRRSKEYKTVEAFISKPLSLEHLNTI